jgi:hypothetical protein
MLNTLVIYTICGLLAITILDTLGAVASRKLNMKYGYLAALSLSIYTALGYFITEEYNVGASIMSTCLVGMYDATIGWHFCIILNANFGITEEEFEQITMPRRIITILIMSSAFGYIGSLMAAP